MSLKSDSLYRVFLRYETPNHLFPVEHLKSFFRNIGISTTVDEIQFFLEDLVLPYYPNNPEIGAEDILELTFEQFSDVALHVIQESDLLKEVQEAFSVFDKDGDGFITQEELGEVMDAKKAKVIMDAGDADGNGEIDKEEFINLITFGF